MNDQRRLIGTVKKLEKDFGNGGVGLILDNFGTEYFFHCRHVLGGRYKDLAINDAVEFSPLAARSAMGAGAQARKIRLLTMGGHNH